MAQFTRANGDFYPVLRLDATGYTNPGVNAVQSAATRSKTRLLYN